MASIFPTIISLSAAKARAKSEDAAYQRPDRFIAPTKFIVFHIAIIRAITLLW